MSETTVEIAAGLDAGTAPVVHAALHQIRHLATLPATALEIIRLADDPDSPPEIINHVVSNDPALCARILKVVNSTFYGLPRKIGSINHAIVMLGVNALKNIALAASLDKVFRGGHFCPVFNAHDLWMHSVGVAAGARLLATRKNLHFPDEAFLAGLIHDMGVMVEMQALYPQFIQVVEKCAVVKHFTFRQTEQRILGATHEDFGAGLCRAWKFPVALEHVAGYHHHPLDLVDGNVTLTSLVYVADILTARAGIGYTRTVDALEIDPVVRDSLGLTEGDLDEVSQTLLGAVEEAHSMLS